MKKILYNIFFVCLVIGGVQSLQKNFWETNSITDYQKYCVEKEVKKSDCRKWEYAAIDYTVEMDGSFVSYVYSSKSYNSEKTYLKNCYVTNKRNWNCKNDLSDISYLNGIIRENTFDTRTYTTEHISFLNYYWNKVI